jgi:capsid assembly protease
MAATVTEATVIVNPRQVAQQLLNKPVALLPSSAKVLIQSYLADDDGNYAYEEPTALADSAPMGYDVVCGVACIQIEGTLLQKTGSLRPFWGFTGYDGVRANFLHALANPAVKAIVLDVNSGGGEVSGMLDLSDTIFKARGTKPIWSICADTAYSAAYCLASAADYITVPRTGGCGSVGIISMLTDYSKAITSSGLSVYFVHYGDDKALETRESHTGIKPDLLARVQQDVDAMGDLFTATVARNRGMSQAAVVATQADYFLGNLGVKAGFADAVMSPDQAFSALLTKL